MTTTRKKPTTTVKVGDDEREVSVAPRVVVACSPNDPVWQAHAQWEAKYPGDARLEKAYELQRERRHVQWHGSLDGFEAHRTFPCQGTMRFYDQGKHHWIAQCDECGHSVAVRRADIDREHLVSERRMRAQLPQQFTGLVVKQDEPGQTGARNALRWWVEHYDRGGENPRAPMLVGPSGRGKTHLLVAAAEVMIKRHLCALRYTTLADLLMGMRAEFGQTTSTVLARAQEAEVLVLDDMGAERDTDFAHETLRALIDVRYRDGRPILASTNHPPGEWPAAFGERTASRLAGMTDVVLIEGPDWRQK